MEKDIYFAVSWNHGGETLTDVFEESFYIFSSRINMKFLTNQQKNMDKWYSFQITKNYPSGPDRQLQTKPMRVRS